MVKTILSVTFEQPGCVPVMVKVTEVSDGFGVYLGFTSVLLLKLPVNGSADQTIFAFVLEAVVNWKVVPSQIVVSNPAETVGSGFMVYSINFSTYSLVLQPLLLYTRKRNIIGLFVISNTLGV